MNQVGTSKTSTLTPQLSWIQKTAFVNLENVSNHSSKKYLNSYPYAYISYKSLGDALSAVANANATQSHHKSKVVRAAELSQISLHSGVAALRPRGSKILEELHSAENTELSSTTSDGLEVNFSPQSPISESSELHLIYGDSRASTADTNEEQISSTKNNNIPGQPLKSVFVRDLPSDYPSLALINSVQLLQEKIILATSRAEKFLDPKSSTQISAKELENGAERRQKTLTGLATLRELLNEPFIPEGYELTGKHLQLATSAVRGIEELLSTELFRKIQRRPLENPTQKPRVTWAPNLPKNFPAQTSFYDGVPGTPSSTSVTVIKNISKYGVMPKKVDAFLQLPPIRHQWKASDSYPKTQPPKVKKMAVKKGPSTTKTMYNAVMTSAERGKRDAEKGLVGIEIDEFDPASCFFYRDPKGTYNAHKDHFKGFKEEMKAIQKKLKK